MVLYKSEFVSPLGGLVLVTRDEELCALAFAEAWPEARAVVTRRFGSIVLHDASPPAAIRGALDAYFSGDLASLARPAVDPGGTEFQSRVWAALRKVPPGTTITYSELAERVGQPMARRAVARANAANPIALAIPCHRVVAVGGRIEGYSGGVERKRWLIEHERKHAGGPPSAA